MPQLLLNNWAVPVAEAKAGMVAVGEIVRAYSGVLRRVEIANKREWSIKTCPMLYADAAALEGLLLARGEYWPGDSDVFSTKGTPALQDNGTLATPGKFSNGFWARAGTVNLFDTNVRTGGDALTSTTGFLPMLLNNGYNGAQVDATLSLSAAQKYQGNYSIYVDCSSANSQYFSGASALAPVSPNTQYTFSAYTRGDDKGSGVALATVVWGNNDGVTITARQNGINATTAWERWTCTFTTGAACTSVRCIIGEALNGGYKFFTDAWQMEAGAVASPWTDAPSSPTNLAYDISPEVALGVDAVSFAGWAKSPTVGGTFACLQSPAGGNASIRLTYSSTNTLTATVVDEAGLVSSCVATWSTPTTLAHLGMVVFQAPASGPAVFLYLNGALVASTAANVPDLKALTNFYLGNRAGTNPWGSNGVVDEVNFYPFAASQGLLYALATASVQQGRYPQLNASGNLIYGTSPVAVLGSDVQTQLVEGQINGVWYNNLSIVEFALSEV